MCCWGCESYESPAFLNLGVQLPISLRLRDQLATMNADSGVTSVL